MNPHPDKFHLQVQATAGDIDVMGHVNNVVYLRWVQEVATAHWLQVAPLPIQQQYKWVVLRHEIDYHRPAFLHDRIQGYTWVGAHQGAKFERFVSLYRAGTEELLAAAKTTWCLLDGQTLRPRRIGADIWELL